MANTLTNLIPTIYEAADIVSRELTGFIPAVQLNADASQAAVGQTIRFPVTGADTAADIVAAATGPDPSPHTVASDTMTISKSRGVTFYYTGEEQRGLGGLLEIIMRDKFTQAMRTLVNEVENDLAGLYVAASRAYGTAGTTPFGTAGDYTDASFVRKIIADNGAPMGDIHLVINTAAGANIRGKQFKANETGDTTMLRRGVLLDVHGFSIRESAQIRNHTKGTGANYTLNGTHTVGTTSLTVQAGTGSILAGDVLALAGDPNRYVVTTALSGNTVVIAQPGLRQQSASGTAITVGNNYAANLAFSRDAIQLLARVPSMPEGGDAADDVIVITDPVSGLSFQVAMYRQRRRVAYEVGLAWGVKAIKPAHMAILLG